MKDVKKILVVLLFFFSIQTCMSQIITSISTDKVLYEYGETIKVTFSIFNASDSTIKIFPIRECPPSIRLNDYLFEIWCLSIDWTLFLQSKMKATWNWTIEPSKLGMPNVDGVQKIRCSYGIVKDSVNFYAPKYRGGNIYIRFRDSTPKIEYVKLRDSLNAKFSARYQDTASAFQYWYVTNKSIDSLVERYKDDFRIKSISAVRELLYDSRILTEASDRTSLPSVYSLSQNYPNPFNPETTISYKLPAACNVSLKVYDVLGREIATLVNEFKQAGTHNCKLRIENGELTSGIYFYRLQSGSYSETKKLILLK